MIENNNTKIAREYLAALSTGAGPQELERFFTADVVQQEFPNRLVPNGATRNLDAIKDGRLRGQALLESEDYEVTGIVAHEDAVAMEVIWTAAVKVAAGPFSAGQLLRAHFAVFLEFRDGRIARQRNYDCFDAW
jgi:ketosteroid isomerase-like protein